MLIALAGRYTRFCVCAKTRTVRRSRGKVSTGKTSSTKWGFAREIWQADIRSQPLNYKTQLPKFGHYQNYLYIKFSLGSTGGLITVESHRNELLCTFQLESVLYNRTVHLKIPRKRSIGLIMANSFIHPTYHAAQSQHILRVHTHNL